MPFLPLPEIDPQAAPAQRRHSTPRVRRGGAAHWPAVRQWTFERLAGRVVDAPVAIVRGNRERERTRFESASLRQYLAGLDACPAAAAPRYLKEFDLFAAAPELLHDLQIDRLLPRQHVRSMRCWIGSAGSATGLHRDLLDNVSVQVIGRKRWRFIRPGVVERLGAQSDKYDAWAVLSAADAGELAASLEPGDGYEVDLHPGDVLELPAGWWHEVINLDASLFIGTFHGPKLPVFTRWLWVAAREQLHRRNWLAPANCTCHPIHRT